MRSDPNKLKSDYNNPCLKEQELSFRCMHENNFERDACAIPFLNYKACKEFWNNVKVMRRREGTKPYMPPPEEREKIRAEHFASRPR